MSDEVALLAQILADPADDTVRLVLADWLQENGQPQRAEFIRVQVELHALTRPRAGEPYHADAQWPEWKRFVSESDSARCARVQHLRTREADLLWPPGPGAQWFPDGWLCRLDRDSTQYGARTLFVGRGFVARVTCSDGDWLDTADALLAAHPVTVVRLTALPDNELLWRLLREARKKGRRVSKRFAEWDLPAVLRYRWPGVAFELPPR